MKKLILASGMLAISFNAFSAILTLGSDYLVLGSDSDGGKISGGGYYYSPHIEDIVNNFIPISLTKRLEVISISCLVTYRDETFVSYDGDYLLSFEIRDFNGVVKHQVSKNTIDLDTPQKLDILIPKLSYKASDRYIEPNEYLALHAYRIGSPPPCADPFCTTLPNTVNLYCEAEVR